MTGGVVALIILILFVLFVAGAGVKIVPQAKAGVVERLGRFQRTLDPGLALLVPFVDRMRPLIDLREQVVSFPPQPTITEDNLVVAIDTVIYFTVTDPKAATYAHRPRSALARPPWWAAGRSCSSAWTAMGARSRSVERSGAPAPTTRIRSSSPATASKS